MSDFIEQIQPDLFYKLASESLLSTISIFKIREHRFESEISEALSSATFDATQSGKKPGASIEVLMPMLSDPKASSPGPECILEMRCIVKENTEINMAVDGSGTGLSAEAIALRVLQLQHLFMIQYAGYCGLTFFPAETFYVANRDFDGLVAYDVVTRARQIFAPLPRVTFPSLTENSLTVTMTDTMPGGGSSLYYTIDGSFPGPANPTAVLYAAPFVVTSGTVVRFAGYQPNLAGSHVGYVLIS